MKLCNDRGDYIQPSCRYLSTYVKEIRDNRCAGEAIFGQIFDTDKYNVVVSFANCNHSPSQKPSDYAQPGPNGNCN